MTWLGAAFLDEQRYELRSEAAAPVHLTSAEMVLLRGLLFPGGVTTRATLMDRLSSGRREPSYAKSLDVLLLRLRRKLGQCGIKVHTIWGVGYELIAPGAPDTCPLCGRPA